MYGSRARLTCTSQVDVMADFLSTALPARASARAAAHNSRVGTSAPGPGRSAGALRVGAGASSVGCEPAMGAQPAVRDAPGTAAVLRSQVVLIRAKCHFRASSYQAFAASLSDRGLKRLAARSKVHAGTFNSLA